MSTLVNLVLAVVLNLFSYGNIPNTDVTASPLEISRTEKHQAYQLEDLRTHYLITKEEVTQHTIGTH